MSSLVVVVKSHLFPQFVRLNREIGTSRRHWGDGEFAAVNRKPRWAGTIPGSYMGRRRQLLTTLTHNRYLVRRTRYTVGGHTANKDTRVISGGRRGSVVLAGERTPGKAAAVTERGEVAQAACSLARAVSCTWAAPGQRENTETVVKQKQLPSVGLAPSYHARGARPEDHVSANY